MNKDACFSHLTDHWSTPKKMYDRFIENGYIDPCPLHCEVDNLQKVYKHKAIFINPPYSQIDKWVDFIKRNVKKNYIALLIPARTDTKYFHELLSLEPFIVFIKGRLHFNEAGAAPFPSILMYFGDNRKGYYDNFVDSKDFL